MPNSKQVIGLKIAGLCGIINPVIVLTLISLAISYSTQFSWTTNALSDLGVQNTVAIFFNSSLIIGGILALIFAVGLRVIFQNRTLGHAGTLILILAAVSLCAIGIFPETAGTIHSYVSVAFFTLLPISLFFMGFPMILDSFERNLGLFTVLVGVVMIVVWTLPWHGGVAIPEILASLAASAWSIVFGTKLFRQASSSIGVN